MIHLPQLIRDLGLIMGAAAVVTLLCKRLKQPVVLGYIIVGLLVGPHFPLFPSITDIENVEVWAEIGVIFLLFSLGLEFSFKKLVKVGGSSSITAMVQILFMIGIGYGAGRLMGWPQMDCIFLGATLSMSSTTIILRAFDELGVKSKKFAGIVFGALIVEDLVAIVLMVLLSTIAISQNFAGMEMLFSISKLLFFLILWFVGGIFFIPTFLKKAKNYMSDETMLIVSLSLCFLMVVLATAAGFSPALGAFIMGSILAETTQGGRIEHLVKPIKDLFGAVFFVSVGMLINPQTLVDYAGPIAIVTLVTIFGKTLTTTMGALIAGQPLKQSVQAGMSLAQIGEFSFIIATLGVSLNVTSAFLYPVIVAVSAVTTFTTPYLIKASTPAYNWLEAHLPRKLKDMLTRYSSDAQAIRVTSDWKLVLRSHLLQMVVYTVIIVGIILLVSRYIIYFVPAARDGGYWINIVATLVTIAVIAPFLWALAIRRIQPEAAARLWADRRYKSPLLVLQFTRILLALFYVGLLINSLLSYYMAIGALLLVVVVIVINQKRLQNIYSSLERRFISNFNAREEQERQDSGNHLVPWDAHITSFSVSPNFSGTGKTLLDLRFREDMGVNIAMIRRGATVINVPDRNERIFPDDILYVIGTDEQLETFRNYLDSNSATKDLGQSGVRDISLQLLEIKDDSEFAGKSIKDSAIRERTKGLVVGIERGGERILNPESSVVLQTGDLVWIVGNKARIKLLVDKERKHPEKEKKS
jgi:CPA2 family monovalent cation:H+ antiporter-2